MIPLFIGFFVMLAACVVLADQNARLRWKVRNDAKTRDSETGRLEALLEQERKRAGVWLSMADKECRRAWDTDTRLRSLRERYGRSYRKMMADLDDKQEEIYAYRAALSDVTKERDEAREDYHARALEASMLAVDDHQHTLTLLERLAKRMGRSRFQDDVRGIVEAGRTAIDAYNWGEGGCHESTTGSERT